MPTIFHRQKSEVLNVGTWERVFVPHVGWYGQKPAMGHPGHVLWCPNVRISVFHLSDRWCTVIQTPPPMTDFMMTETRTPPPRPQVNLTLKEGKTEVEMRCRDLRWRWAWRPPHSTGGGEARSWPRPTRGRASTARGRDRKSPARARRTSLCTPGSKPAAPWRTWWPAGGDRSILQWSPRMGHQEQTAWKNTRLSQLG